MNCSLAPCVYEVYKPLSSENAPSFRSVTSIYQSIDEVGHSSGSPSPIPPTATTMTSSSLHESTAERPLESAGEAGRETSAEETGPDPNATYAAVC